MKKRRLRGPDAYGAIFEAVADTQRGRGTVRTDDIVVLTADMRRQQWAPGATQTLYERLAGQDWDA